MYYMCADILNAIRHPEDPHPRMCNAEVITPALVAEEIMAHFLCSLKRFQSPQARRPHQWVPEGGNEKLGQRI
jgi:hypothetical protein